MIKSNIWKNGNNVGNDITKMHHRWKHVQSFLKLVFKKPEYHNDINTVIKDKDTECVLIERRSLDTNKSIFWVV